MTKQESIDFLYNHSKIGKDGKRRFYAKAIKSSKEYNNIIKYIKNITDYKNIKPIDIIFCLENNINSNTKCKTCGKFIPFKIEKSNKIRGWYIKEYCNLKCFNNDPEIKIEASIREKKKAKERLVKRKKTIIKKYGSWENRPGRDNFKIANNKLKNNPEYKKTRILKTEETNLKKYGVRYSNQIPGEGKRRHKLAEKTIFRKYGVLNPMHFQQFLYNSIPIYIPKLNYIKLNKKFLEKHFLNSSNFIEIDKLISFLNCTKVTAYKIFERFGVDYTRRVGCFELDKPAILYYIYDPKEDLYKIGITNNSLEERFGKAFCSKRAIALMEQSYKKGIDALKAEQEILKAFKYVRCTNDSWPEALGGKTEFFKEDILKLNKRNIKW